MPQQRLSLSTLRDGLLEERFQTELAKLIANLRDPNTPREKVREIKITLRFKAAEDRQFAHVGCDVTTKLAARSPLQTYTLFDYEGEELVALEQLPQRGKDPRQREMAPVQPIRQKPND